MPNAERKPRRESKRPGGARRARPTTAFKKALLAAPSSDDPEQILAYAAERFAGRIALATSLGPQTLVLIDMAHRLGLELPAFALDTGLLFPETYELWRTVEERYGIRVRPVAPPIDLEAQERLHGPALWRRDPDLCCSLRKVEPMRHALRGLDAWVTGLRRDQSPSRAGVQPIAWDPLYGLVKVSPLAGWTRDRVDAYLAAHAVPYNPLLDRGYRSIGCWPCTAPAARGSGSAEERGGRWPGTAKTECGLHAVLPGNPGDDPIDTGDPT